MLWISSSFLCCLCCHSRIVIKAWDPAATFHDGESTQGNFLGSNILTNLADSNSVLREGYFLRVWKMEKVGDHVVTSYGILDKEKPYSAFIEK